MGGNGNDDEAALARARRVLEASPPLVDAVGSLYDDAIRRVLSGSYRITSAAEGKRLLTAEDTTEAMADHVQRVVVLAVPIVRTLARGARFTRVPWVLVATTAFSIASTLKAGIREVQTIGVSPHAPHRDRDRDAPADPGSRAPARARALPLAAQEPCRVEARPLPLRRLVQRWLFKGAFGRDTRRAAEKALDAAERLDLRAYLQWRAWPIRYAEASGRRRSSPIAVAPMDRRGCRIVTGGSRGIGAAVARAAAAAGWGVCLTFHTDADAAASVVAEIEAAGGRGDGRARRRRLRDATSSPPSRPRTRWGRSRRSSRTQASSAARRGSTSSPSSASSGRSRSTCVGTIVCCREAVRRLSSRHGGSGGSIVLVSSAAARLGSPDDYVDYAASKGAVDTLGLGLAREVAAEGIRVNVVRPGIIETDIHANGGPARPGRADDACHPGQRPGRADEVAAAVVWLLGDDASYCTGSILDVSGGR